MPTVIILGFRYNDLTSSITDIYRIYSYYKRLSYRIYVGSDIVNPEKPPDLASLLASNSLDQYFIPFLNKEFVTIRRLVRSKNDLKEFLNKVDLTSDRRLIVYYSGHGEEGCFRMPDGSRYRALEFRNDLLKIGSLPNFEEISTENSSRSISKNDCQGISSIGSQIFIILDCCNPHGLYLPFKLGRESQEYIQVTKNFVVPQVILISSSEPTQKSRADSNESPFTKHLFSRFRDPKSPYDLFSVLNFIDTGISENDKFGQQKCTAYASYTSLKMLWSWVVTNKIDIDINQEIDSLIVRLRRSQEK